MRLVKDLVYFDEENAHYIKFFNQDKWYSLKGLKVRFGLYKTPGKSTEDITHKLNNLGIITPELVEVEDYRVVTKEVPGISYGAYRQQYGKMSFHEELIDIFIKITKAGCIHVDPNMYNFLCDGERLIVIDLDSIFDLADVPLKFLPRQKHLYKLWFRSDQDYELVEKVAQVWPKRTLWQKCMDTLYSVRTIILGHTIAKRREEMDFLKHITPYFPK